MKKKILLIGAMIAICLSGCTEEDDKTEATTRTTTEATTTEKTTEATTEETTEATTEAEVYSDYEITYSNAKTWVNSIGDTKVQVIVEVENTGTTNLYLASPNCDLEDAEGNLVAIMDNMSACPNVIEPGEKGYMYEVATLDDYAGDGELVVNIRPDIEEARIEKIEYTVTDVTLKENDYGKVEVIGRVTNTTDEIQDKSYVEVVYFDKDHIPIGYESTSIMEDLKLGDKIGFEVSGIILPDFVNLENVADYKIYAHPFQYQ